MASAAAKDQDIKPMLIRLPVDLYDKFSAICESERRSRSGQANLLIESYVKECEEKR